MQKGVTINEEKVNDSPSQQGSDAPMDVDPPASFKSEPVSMPDPMGPTIAELSKVSTTHPVTLHG